MMQKLDDGVGKGGRDGIRESLAPVDAADEDVFMDTCTVPG